jgi:hypothetical protein
MLLWQGWPPTVILLLMPPPVAGTRLVTFELSHGPIDYCYHYQHLTEVQLKVKAKVTLPKYSPQTFTGTMINALHIFSPDTLYRPCPCNHCAEKKHLREA